MAKQNGITLEHFTKHGDVALAIGIVGVLVSLIIPLPAAILDVLLTMNITLGILILLTSALTPRPLDFSVFPSLLLFTTLFRLSLNVATTRQILLNGYAGKVIEIFGSFVVGGNYIVGTVIFLILVVIQFAVITKGSTRIAEVAARFTLDSMPGKQLSIDADLNAGLISEDEAKQKRKDLSREGDFYGAMDGASKFVRGDAMAGIIITFINILGGIGIGFFQQGVPIVEALQKYTLLTIGDGLIAQIPSLIIATASGIIVTRAGDSEESLGANITRQFFIQPQAAIISSVILVMFGLVPGFPKIPFFLVGSLVGAAGYMAKNFKPVEEEEVVEEVDEETERRDKLEQLLQVDPMEIEIGYGLIPLVDMNQGGTLLDRINLIRKQFANDYGMIIPSIRIRDNIQLQPNEYSIKVRDVQIANGSIEPERYLAMNPGTAIGEIDGEKTTEPAFGLPAVWIDESRRDYAESSGYTVVDDVSVLATHLTELIRSHLHELLTRQDVQNLMDNLKETNKAVVEEVVPNMMSLGTVHRVLQNLLRESVSVRNLGCIMETLSDYGQKFKDPDVLSEVVRHNLGRSITAPLLDRNRQLNVISVDPNLEKMISDAIHTTERGTQLVIDPSIMQVIVNNIAHKVERVSMNGEQPVLICSPAIRFHLKRMCESRMPYLTVISYAEVDPKIVIRPLDVVALNHQEAANPSNARI